MNYDEAKHLLAQAAARDNRTPSQAMALAWQTDLADIGFAEAQEAVNRHFRSPASLTEWLKPAHVRALVKVIREEGRKGQTEPLALPSRFEQDEIRDSRIAKGVEVLADHWKAPEGPPVDDLHGQALLRARRERGKRPVPGQRGSRVGGRNPVMPKLAPPPWASPEAAELQAIAALHEAGKSCGRRSCTRCQEAR